MSHGSTYYQWCAQMSSNNGIARFLQALPLFSLSQRKVVLLACRVQTAPHVKTRLYQRNKSIWDSYVSIPSSYQPKLEMEVGSKVQSLLNLTKDISDYFNSSILSGFISSMVRSAPHEGESFKESLKEMITKEIMASTRIKHPVELDYGVIFDESFQARHHPFAPNLDPSSSVAQYIHYSLKTLRKTFDGMILYPKISNKTIGKKVQAEFEKVAPEAVRNILYDRVQLYGGYTTRDLQYLEFWYRIVVEGPVELRTSWGYNILKPRPYFAQGGTTFGPSRSIQPIFNRISEVLVMVHPKDRFLEPTGQLTKEMTIFIYDYAAFTSNLEEIKRFLANLANFYRGVTVFVVEDKDELIKYDLGDLLDAYNTECNYYAEFDITGLKDFDLDKDDFPLLAHTCGMLGVPGNITGATILHGIHAAFIAKDHNFARCIGDDAKIYKEVNGWLEEKILQLQINNLGEVAVEKVEKFPYDEEDDYEDRAWHFAKRPILRTHNRVITFFLSTFATLDCILGLVSSERTVSPGSTTILGRRSKFNSIWSRFLVRISIEQELTEEERDFLVLYQKRCFIALGIAGRRAGPHYNEEGRLYCIPPYLQREEFGQDPYLKVADEYGFDEEVRVPCLGNYTNGPLGYVGEEFLSRKTKCMAFMEKMGILSASMEYEMISKATDGPSFVQRIFALNPILYKFTVMRVIPSYMYYLLPVPI